LEKEVGRINSEAVKLARMVAGERAFVAGAVGGLPALVDGASGEEISETQVRAIFREQITALAEAGADLIQLETFTSLPQARWAVEEAKACCDLVVIAQMVLADGRHTADGVDGFVALESLRRAGADVVGTNCGHGVSKVLRAIEYLGGQTDAKLSAFANAGLPEQVEGRSLYLASPGYMAEAAERMVKAGANLVGGCCGTTAADIAAIAGRIGGMRPTARRGRGAAAVTVVERAEVVPVRPRAAFLGRLKEKTVVLVELDSPKGTDIAKTLRSAKAIKEAGADAITIGDSPLATMRMNSIIMGSLIEREVDVPVICHLACRDRNVIGMQGLLLGADALGLHSVLALTGDPAKVGDHPEASSVYDLNSFKLIEMIARMNRGQGHMGQSIGRATCFEVGVAFNPNVRNLESEVKRLKKKVERGATFALTQAVFDAEVMRRACEAAKELGIAVFAGVFPLLSSRHAEFLHNEFPGITVSEEVRHRMAGVGSEKEKMAAEGMAIARELIDAFRVCADGLYLIPPLNRAAIAVELLQYIHRASPVARGR
jgi:homocysteine S-methyltransferase